MAADISAQAVRNILAGYGLDACQVSDDWLEKRRDNSIIPYVESKTGLSLAARGEDGQVESVVTRVTEYHSGTGSSILPLNNKPILSLYSINLITNPSNWMFVSPQSVEIIPKEGILKLKAVLESWQNFVPAFPRGTDNIKIDYSYGFTTLPDDLAECVNFLVASMALGFLGARTGGGSVNVPGIGRTYGARGKYSDIRIELERYAVATMRRYIIAIVGQ